MGGNNGSAYIRTVTILDVYTCTCQRTRGEAARTSRRRPPTRARASSAVRREPARLRRYRLPRARVTRAGAVVRPRVVVSRASMATGLVALRCAHGRDHLRHGISMVASTSTGRGRYHTAVLVRAGAPAFEDGPTRLTMMFVIIP
jgi:hypothetical protein